MAHFGKGPFDEATTRQYEAFAEKGLGALFEATRGDLAKMSPDGWAPASILDVGAGPGVLTSRLAELYPTSSVTGVDPSRPMLARARARSSGRVAFLEGAAEALPVPDRSVDLLVSHNTVKHWADRPRAMREISRVLKSDGAIWICEIDRHAAFSDIHHWCAPMIPPLLAPLLALGFKLGVSRRGLTLAELDRLVELVPLASRVSGRLPALPIVRVAGRLCRGPARLA